MLYRYWERWKAFAHKIGNFQARILLSIFYFLLFSPFALGVKLFSDRLMIKKRHLPHWIPSEATETNPWDKAHRQF